MAKRKRKRKPVKPGKLFIEKDYRDDYFTQYIFQIEQRILEAWTIFPDLRDGDVRKALRKLMRGIRRTGQISLESAAGDNELVDNAGIFENFILRGVQTGFEKHGVLNAEDTIGVLSVINSSVGAWNRGMMGQEYLKYIRDFLGRMGSEVRQLTDEEVELLELPTEIDDEEHAGTSSRDD